MDAVTRLHDALEALDLDEVRDSLRITQYDEDFPGFLEAEDVPLVAWNRFAQLYDNLPQGICLRQLMWANDDVWIVEAPLSPQHKATTLCINTIFQTFLPNAVFSTGGFDSVTPNLVTQQGDCTYRPRRTLAGVNAPQLIDFGDWATVVVEILRSQQWASLRAKADIYRQRPGVEYIVSIKMSECLNSWSYCMYDVRANLPPLGQHPTLVYFDARTVPKVHSHFLVLDSRRVLGLQQGDDLPVGCFNSVVVDVPALAAEIRTEFPRRQIA